MENERLLQDLGLTKYESTTYASLLKEGVIGAQELSRKSTVPVGKIYEVLSNLNNMGLVEFQRSRPRKYKAVKPSIALNNLYSKREEETKRELEEFKLRVSEIEDKFSNMAHPDHTEVKFWSTKMGEEDIIKDMRNLISEIELEILHVKPSRMIDIMNKGECFDADKIIPVILDEFINAAKKGIKIRSVVPGDIFINAMKKKFAGIEDIDTKQKIIENINTRVLECEYDFTIIDDYLVYVPIPDPLEPSQMFGEMKMYDREYAQKLKMRFEELWSRGKKVVFE
ncbi:helix-turn-helix domain-containing protein [Methanolobus sp. ZRKC3]|uniref:TrmB family transcriptional regulator n=1 Tax=Methanolobus sp. ZRKC3 TaxID=3125786 RepID=UPI00324E5F55